MIIPHHMLSPEALEGIIEEFITREGTDYGEYEVDLEAKAAQVQKQLDDGTAVIVFNAEDSSCTILPKDQAPEEWQAEACPTR
jgi:uncharacterized protein YheU (UPF0270 family)